MKKIGTISDTRLAKKAGRDVKKRKAAATLIRTKYAMLKHVMDETEKVGALKFNPKVKSGMIKSAAQFIPSEWMLKEGAGIEVFKAAELVLMKIFKEAHAKLGDKMYDIEGTKKAQLAFQKSFEQGLLKKKAAIDAYFKKKYAENENKGMEELTEDILAQLGGGAESTEEKTVQDTGDYNDMLSGIHAQMSDGEGDPSDVLSSIPYYSEMLTDPSAWANLGIADEFVKDTEGASGMGKNLETRHEGEADIDRRVGAILKKAETLLKAAEGGVADPIPNDDPSMDTAAEKTVNDMNKVLATEDKTGEGITAEAGDDLDWLAEAAELDKLLDPEGASPEDQTNPVTAVSAVDSPESEKKVNTQDKGKSASGGNIFSMLVDKVREDMKSK